MFLCDRHSAPPCTPTPGPLAHSLASRASITLSPVYTAGGTYLGGERGLSLRFPRFIRRRDDKTVDEATTSEEFADMFRRQMAQPQPARPVVPRAGSEDGVEDGARREGEREVGVEREEGEEGEEKGEDGKREREPEVAE
jgi:DNA ligase-1